MLLKGSFKVDGHLEGLVLRSLLEGCICLVPLGIREVCNN